MVAVVKGGINDALAPARADVRTAVGAEIQASKGVRGRMLANIAGPCPKYPNDSCRFRQPSPAWKWC